MRWLCGLLLALCACSERSIDDGNGDAAPPADLASVDFGSQAELRVTLDAAQPISGIDHFTLTFTANGTMVRTITLSAAPGVSIPPPQHLVVVVPGAEAGPVTLEVVAFDAAGNPLAIGRGTAVVTRGQSVNLDVILMPIR